MDFLYVNAFMGWLVGFGFSKLALYAFFSLIYGSGFCAMTSMSPIFLCFFFFSFFLGVFDPRLSTIKSIMLFFD